METNQNDPTRILLAFAVAFEAALATPRWAPAEPCPEAARVRLGPLDGACELRVEVAASGAPACCLALRVGTSDGRDAWLARCAGAAVPHAWFVDLREAWLERYREPRLGRYRRRALAYGGDELALPFGASARKVRPIRVPALAPTL